MRAQLLSPRRWLLLGVVFVALWLLCSAGVRSAHGQTPLDDTIQRVKEACESVGIKNVAPTTFGFCPGPGRLGTSYTSSDKDMVGVEIGVYNSGDELEACQEFAEILAKPKNLDLNTDWAYVETAGDKLTGRGTTMNPTQPAGSANVDFRCGDVIVIVWLRRTATATTTDMNFYQAEGARLAEAVKPNAVELARRLAQALATRKVCMAYVVSPEPGEVRSVPKDQKSYFYESAFPLLASQRPDAPSLQTLLDRRSGELEIVFTCKDRKGQEHKEGERRKIAELLPANAQQEAQWAQEGRIFLRTRNVTPQVSYLALHVGYQLLDKLEALTLLRENATQALADGETWDNNVLWGAEQTFQWTVAIYDDKGLAGRSTADKKTTLRYLVRFPVVFVPGTGGSRLSATGGNELWPARVNTWSYAEERQYFDLLRLDEQGKGAAILATDVLRAYGPCAPLTGPVTGCVYQGGVDSLARRGYKENELLFLFPYDWRLGTGQGTGQHALGLDKVVDAALARNYNRKAATAGDAQAPQYARQGTDKVILIAHSLGGLVVRAYCADAKRAGKVQEAIMLGTPNLGTMKTVKTVWTTGYIFDVPFASPPLGKWLASTLPAAYEQFPVTADGKLDRFLFDAQGNLIQDTRQEMLATQTHLFCTPKIGALGSDCGPVRLSATILDAGLQLRQTLPAKTGVPTFIIASYDQPTIVAFRRDTRLVAVGKVTLGATYQGSIPYDKLAKVVGLPEDTIVQASYTIAKEDSYLYYVEIPYYREIIRNCGDNLVPLFRCVGLAGAEAIYVSGVGHGGYTEDPTVMKHIGRLLAGVRPVGKAKPACEGKPEATTEAVQIQASSPANLHVYDGEGRHTGLAKDGSREVSIPGSQFEVRGSIQEVILPYTTRAVRVVLEGTREGRVDLHIVAGDGGSEWQAQWVGITETVKMRAEMQFVPRELGAKTVLKLDVSGDGKAVQSLPPVVTRSVQGPAPTSQPASATGAPASPVAATRPAGGALVATPGTARSAGSATTLVCLGLGLAVLALGSCAGAMVVLVRRAARRQGDTVSRRARGNAILLAVGLVLLALCLCAGSGVLLVSIPQQSNGGKVSGTGTTPAATPTLGTPVTVLSGGAASGGQWTSPQPGLIEGEASEGDALYLYDGSYGDLTFSAEVLAADREASLAFRMQDALNGYLVVFVPQGATGATPGVWLLKRVKGVEQTLASSRDGLPGVGQWATLTVQANGTRLRVSLNGKLVVDVTDRAAPAFASGKVGLRLYGVADTPCYASFRNVQVR